MSLRDGGIAGSQIVEQHSSSITIQSRSHQRDSIMDVRNVAIIVSTSTHERDPNLVSL